MAYVNDVQGEENFAGRSWTESHWKRVLLLCMCVCVWFRSSFQLELISSYAERRWAIIRSPSLLSAPLVFRFASLRVQGYFPCIFVAVHACLCMCVNVCVSPGLLRLQKRGNGKLQRKEALPVSLWIPYTHACLRARASRNVTLATSVVFSSINLNFFQTNGCRRQYRRRKEPLLRPVVLDWCVVFSSPVVNKSWINDCWDCTISFSFLSSNLSRFDGVITRFNTVNFRRDIFVIYTRYMSFLMSHFRRKTRTVLILA